MRTPSLTSFTVIAALVLAGSLNNAAAFVPSPHLQTKATNSPLMAQRSLEDESVNDREATTLTRRSAFAQSITVASAFFGVAAGLPNVAAAKKAAPVLSDKEKIVEGYKRLDYLLTNWEKETTVCGRTDNPYLGCERTPEKVMEYLGYKSMEDPLFRADKTLIRLQNLVPNDPDAQADYQEALDVFVEKAESANGMAFISSWGEANPGGGKDRVALFIERSKKDVIDTRDSLKTVIRILDLKVD